MRWILWAQVGWLCLGMATAQTFEVASVRRSAPDITGSMACDGGPGSAAPQRFTCRGMALAGLVSLAYGLQYYQVEGLPDWANSGLANGYDVSANVPANAAPAEFRAMLQALLQERFGMEARMETLPRTGWAITSSDKPRLTASDPVTARNLQPQYRNGAMHIVARSFPLNVLASYLTTVLRGPVVDQTGIAGNFDFTLDFIPDYLGTLNAPAPSPDSPVPTLGTALSEQLGLKLVKQTVPLEVLVVTRVLRDPGAN
jgi:uncharacterized protein (TIGR03435 family)